MKDDRERLLHILDAIEAIVEKVGNDRATYESDEMAQVWVLHHLMIVGEAASRVSDNTQALGNAIPWRDIVALRNLLVHELFRDRP